MFSYICQPKFKISLSRCEGKKKAIYNASILLTGEIEFDRGETYQEWQRKYYGIMYKKEPFLYVIFLPCQTEKKMVQESRWGV
jgi:hypothetical protein